MSSAHDTIIDRREGHAHIYRRRPTLVISSNDFNENNALIAFFRKRKMKSWYIHQQQS